MALSAKNWTATTGWQPVGPIKSTALATATAEDWANFSAAWRSRPTWVFGVLGYDLKNALEPTASVAPRLQSGRA